MAEALRDFLAATTLNGGIDDNDTAIVVSDGSVFPATGTFDIRIDDELIAIASVSGNTLTASARASGTPATTAASHSNGAAVRQILTKRSLEAKISESISSGFLDSFLGIRTWEVRVGTLTYEWQATAGEGETFYNTAGANGDKVGCSVLLDAGTYSLKIRVITGTNRGIVDCLVDGVSVDTSDLYTNPGVFRTDTFDLGALSEGPHSIELLINGKNASSSNYFMSIGPARIVRTA